MRKAKRLLGMLLAAVLMAGSLQVTAFAEEKDAGAKVDANALFANKVKELEKQYGVMKAGAQVVKADSKEFYTSMMSPFDAKTDGGILFTDVRDYDLDKAPELLVVRRERDTGILMQDEEAFDAEMYEYTYDMYEVDEGECTLRANRTIDVYDVLDWSIHFKSISVFLHETSRFIDICTETYISQQDHPSDTALVRIRYNGTDFADENGIRYACWYAENGVRCMRPMSPEALHYLSDIFPSEDTFWTNIEATDSEKDEKFIRARNKRLADLGFKLIKTRQDYMDELFKEELSDAEMAKMDKTFSMLSASECYAPYDGTMTRMAFLTEYVEREMDDNGMTLVDRVLDTEKKVSENK